MLLWRSPQNWSQTHKKKSHVYHRERDAKKGCSDGMTNEKREETENQKRKGDELNLSYIAIINWVLCII